MDNKELKEIGGLLGLVALLESFGVRDEDGNTFKEFLKKNSDKDKAAAKSDAPGTEAKQEGPADPFESLLKEMMAKTAKDGISIHTIELKDLFKPKDTTGRVKAEVGPGDVEVEIGHGGHDRTISVKAGEEVSLGDKFILKSLISDGENKRNGHFAFPFQFDAGVNGKFVSSGMTLREYYAGQALKQALEERAGLEAAAHFAVAAADALIAELRKAEHDEKAGKAEKPSAKAK